MSGEILESCCALVEEHNPHVGLLKAPHRMAAAAPPVSRGCTRVVTLTARGSLL
jgi:hypothetical protein